MFFAGYATEVASFRLAPEKAKNFTYMCLRLKISVLAEKPLMMQGSRSRYYLNFLNL